MRAWADAVDIVGGLLRRANKQVERGLATVGAVVSTLLVRELGR